jgi:hypothetical protein
MVSVWQSTEIELTCRRRLHAAEAVDIHATTTGTTAATETVAAPPTQAPTLGSVELIVVGTLVRGPMTYRWHINPPPHTSLVVVIACAICLSGVVGPR